jgi:S1-C subfamily serine protease
MSEASSGSGHRVDGHRRNLRMSRAPLAGCWALGGVIIALVLLASGCTDSNSARSSGESASASAASVPAGAGSATSLQQTYVRVIHQVLPSVVEIRTSSGLGSGVIYDEAGNIVTNAHVVGSATSFQVQLANSTTALSATLVGTFPADDLAVIKVKGAKNLHPATFGDSSKLRVGDIVLAMGNPLGLASSVTDGIVSAIGRTVSEPQGGGDSPGATLPDAIQTSAAINPGNSGGALVDLAGRVVGIPTLAAVDQQMGGGAAPGIGFAIPSNIVKDIAGQLIKSGRVANSHRAALGVQVSTVAGPDGQPTGVRLVQVAPGSGAAKAGLQAGDVITAVNGTATPDTETLSTVLAGLQPGQTVPVEVTRASGGTATVQVTLGQLPGR